MPRFTRSFTCLLLLALAHAADAANAGATDKRYSLPGHGALALKIPAGWKDKVEQPEATKPPTISFGTADGNPFIVTVSPIWGEGVTSPPGGKTLRENVERARHGIEAFAVEKELKIREFKGASGPGFYFTATDAALTPGGYKFLTKGSLRVGAIEVAFVILTNDGQQKVVRDALSMLRTAAQVQD